MQEKFFLHPKCLKTYQIFHTDTIEKTEKG